MADLKLVIDGDSRGAQSALRGVGGEIKGLSTLAKGGLGVLTALAGGVVALGASAIAAQDDIAKMAIRTGIGVETLSAFKVAAELADASLSDLATGARTLAKIIVDADRGSATATATLRSLGISARDSAGNLTTVESALRTAAESLSKMTSETERTAIAQEAFGRGGLALLPVLADGATGFDRMRERAQALGLAMSEEGTVAAVRFGDAITGIRQIIDGTILTAVDYWLPSLVKVVEFLELVAGLATGRDDEVVRRQMGPGGDGMSEEERAERAAIEAVKASADAERLALIAKIKSRDATKEATTATRERAVAVKDLARAQKEQADFERDYLDMIFRGITEHQEQEDRRREYELSQERARAAELLAIEQDLAAERTALREQERLDAERLRNAEVGLAQDVFAGIGRMADLAYGIVGDSAEGGSARAKAALKTLFVVSKAAALAGAIVNTAQAVTSGLATMPFVPLGIIAGAGAAVAGGVQIATIIGTTIQGLADAGRMPLDALRAAGLNRHSVLAVRDDEAVVDPRGTRDLSAMLAIQRRTMELGAQGSGSGPTVVVAELDGRRMTRGLSPHMARALDDGYDYRLDARVS